MSKMNGIVMESGPGWVLVLLENGEYRKFRSRSFLMPGDIYQGRAYSLYPRYMAVAAAIIIMLLGTLDFYNVLAYARVSSGVEMGINRWNRVISVSAINTEGESILRTIEPKGQDLEKALEMVLEESLKQGDDSSPKEIMVSIQKSDKEKSIPPGIDKKLKKFNSSDDSNEYSLKKQSSQQDKIVYGLSKKNKTQQPSGGNKKVNNKGASSKNANNQDENRKSGVNPKQNDQEDNKGPGTNFNGNDKNGRKWPVINPNPNNKNDSPKSWINPNNNRKNDSQKPWINRNTNNKNDSQKPEVKSNNNKNDSQNTGVKSNSKNKNDSQRTGINLNSNKNNSPKPGINSHTNSKSDSQKPGIHPWRS
jgi:hypothetical protein